MGGEPDKADVGGKSREHTHTGFTTPSPDHQTLNPKPYNRLHDEINEMSRHNKMLAADNHKLRQQIESEGELKESYFQVSYCVSFPKSVRNETRET